MYDLRNEPHEFAAESRQEAIRKACQFYGVDEEALAVAELGPGEVSGLGNRTLVVAVPRDRQPRSSSGGGRERSAPREAHSRDRDRDRDRGRDRGEGRDREGDRRGRGRGRSRRERGGRDEERREEREDAAPSEPSVGTARGELGDAGQFLLGLIERMDLGPFEMGMSSEGDLVVFEVRGPAGQELAQGSGRAVDALQLITNQAALRFDEEHPRVVVDVEGDAEAREEFLSALALRVAQRARESGRAVALDPMNGRDRRLIHLALRDDDDIATMSRGEGRYRQVVVVPEGAPEYEEARQAAYAASRAES